MALMFIPRGGRELYKPTPFTVYDITPLTLSTLTDYRPFLLLALRRWFSDWNRKTPSLLAKI